MSKTIFITGTSSGFGKMMTETFLKNGHKVIATMRDMNDRNKDDAEELRGFDNAEEHLEILELDVTSTESVEQVTNHVNEKYSRLDVLINNAGYGTGGITEGFTEEQIYDLFNVNVFGIHRLTRAFLPMMRRQGNGLIINISSLMGRVVIPFSALYTASKYAVEGYSESLRYELKPMGIDVAIIEPGGFGTSFLDNMTAPKDESRVNEYGDYAKKPEEMWGGVEDNLSGEDAPDPYEVVEAAVKLVNQPNGERDLRIVVDPMMGGGGAPDINDLTKEKQRELLTNFGMAQMLN